VGTTKDVGNLMVIEFELSVVFSVVVTPVVFKRASDASTTVTALSAEDLESPER